MTRKPWTYSFAFIMALGTAVACGDDAGSDDAGGGTGGSSGASGASGSAGKGGTAGQGGASGSAGKGGTAGQGGTAGDGTAGDGGTAGEPGGAGPGGAGPGGQGGEGGDGGGVQACNSLTNGATAVAEVQRTGLLPMATGGTVQPGTYHLTSWEVYSPSTADTGRIRALTLVVTGNTIEVVGLETGGNVPRLSATFTIAGPTITIAHTCPDTAIDVTGYNATAGTPALFRIIRAGESRVETFTRQ